MGGHHRVVYWVRRSLPIQSELSRHPAPPSSRVRPPQPVATARSPAQQRARPQLLQFIRWAATAASCGGSEDHAPIQTELSRHPAPPASRARPPRLVATARSPASGVLRLELLQSIRVSGHRRLVRLGQKITLRFELSCRVIQRRLLRPIGLSANRNRSLSSSAAGFRVIQRRPHDLLGQSQPLALQLSGVLRLELLQSIRVGGHRSVRLGQKITLRFKLSCRVIQRRLLRASASSASRNRCCPAQRRAETGAPAVHPCGGHRRPRAVGQKITLRFKLSCRVIQRRLLRAFGLLSQPQPIALQLSGVL